MQPTHPNPLFISTVDPPIDGPDLPPQSFQIPIHDVLHWFKPAKLLDREPSTIGHANPKSLRTKSHPVRPIKPPNGPIPGIANSGFNLSGTRPKPNLRIFPVNYYAEKKPGPDPGSPKVSCFGRILPEKEGRAGCWGNFAVVLGLAGVKAVSGGVEEDGSRCNYFSGEEGRREGSSKPELLGMKRFSSRRREGDDVDARDCVHVVSLEPLDRECPLRQS